MGICFKNSEIFKIILKSKIRGYPFFYSAGAPSIDDYTFPSHGCLIVNLRAFPRLLPPF